MLTLSDLDRMSRAETVVITPSHETNCSLEQFRELIAAARAWELWQEAANASGLFIGIGWDFDKGYGGNLSFGPLGRYAPYREPQAAVLAALRGAKT